MAMSRRLSVLMSTPSRRTFPVSGTRSLLRHLTKVDLPTPLGPMMHTRLEDSNSALIPCRIFAPDP